ncbi:MAG: hypothetical protein P9M14_14020 [Candidatus Alcyoniella australis]|nr:hypothetical protein [Candidatus Alcyoniella australis]
MYFRNEGVLIGTALFVALLFCIPGATAQDSGSLIAQGDALYLQRSSSDDFVLQAVAKWEQAFQADPASADAAYRISMAYYFLGRFAPADKREALYVKGTQWGEKAYTADPQSAGAHYWYAVNLAKSYEEKSTFSKMTIVGDVQDNLAAALKLDPTFWYGGPDRVIGMVYFKSPLARNSTAVEHLKRSLSYAPNYSLTLVNLGEVLIKEKEYNAACQYLEKVLTLTPDPGFEKELEDDKRLAHELLASIPQ